MFTATAAAMATTPGTDAVKPGQSASAVLTAAAEPLPASIDPQETAARRHQRAQQAVQDKIAKIAAVRASGAARVARSTARKALAVRALEARRAALAHNWRLPLSNPVQSSGFGYRWGRLHAGEDYPVSVGTNLVSMSTGTVVFASGESGYGEMVKIRYWDGTISFYAHMSSIGVNVGETVEPGQVVGQSGNSGHSTGPHLHLEIHPSGGAAVDPVPWLARHRIAR